MKKRIRINKIVLTGTLFLIFSGIIAEILLWYYGGALLQKSLQKIIDQSSNYQYKISFSRLRVNFFTRSMFIEDFKLIPDTCRRENHKNLYYFSFDRFNIKRLSLLGLLLKRQLKIKELSLINPRVKFYKFTSPPKTKNKTPITYEIVKKDFLSGILNVFNGIYIKDIIISGGRLDFLKELRQQNFTAKKISLHLHNFAISQRTFEQKSLFADRIWVEIDNYSIRLKNNHLFAAQKLTISTTDKKIILDDASIRPLKLSDTSTNIFLSTKKIILNNINLNDIYLYQRLSAQSVTVYNTNISVYQQRKTTAKGKSSVQVLNTVKNIFSGVDIDSVNLQDVNIRIYPGYRSSRPSIYLKKGNMTVTEIKITPSTEQIINSFSQLAVNFTSLYTKILHKSHLLAVSHLSYNRLQHHLTIRRVRIIPLAIKNIPGTHKLLNTVINNISIKTTDLIKYIQTNKLTIYNLKIGQGQTTYTLIGEEKKKKKNLNLPDLSIRKINLGSQTFNINLIAGNKKQNFSGRMQVKGKNIIFLGNSLYSPGNVDFTIYGLAIKNSQSPNKINLEQLTINTLTKKISVNQLYITPKHNADSLLRLQHKSIVNDIFVPSLEIDSIDFHKLLINKELILKKIALTAPSIKIISYPEIPAKEYKKQIRKHIREKAASKVVLAASQASFELYQTIMDFNDSTYKDYKRKVLYIDSIQNLALYLIFKIHIPEKAINITDTTASNIKRIQKIAIKSFSDIILQPGQADTIFITTLNKLIEIKKEIEQKKFNLKALRDILLTDLNAINARHIILDNAQIALIQKYSDKQITTFNNLMSIHFANFNISRDSLCHGHILCSDYILAVVKNYRLHLPDSIHTLQLGKLTINTRDSSANIKDFYIQADTNKNMLFPASYFISAYIPDISLKHIDFNTLTDSNSLMISRINIPKSFIHLQHNPQGKPRPVKNKNKTALPIKSIYINSFYAPANQIHYYDKKDTIDFFTHILLQAQDITLDTADKISKLPVKNYFTELYGLKLNIKNKIKLSGKKIGLNSSGLLYSAGMYLNIKDSTKISYDSLSAEKIFPEKIRRDSAIDISWLYVKNPRVELTAKEKTSGLHSGNLQNINPYTTIKKLARQILLDSAFISNLSVNQDNNHLNNIDIIISRLQLDSSARIDTPYLFFSQNIVLTIKDFDRKLSDLYSFSFDTLQVNIQKHNVKIVNLHLAPNYDRDEFVKHLQWRTTMTDFLCPETQIKGLDWKKILFSRQLKADRISFKKFHLYAYTDRNIPHDYSKKKPHFIDFVLKSPVPIDINNIILQQGKIIYEEKAPKHATAGHIELNRTNIVISNIQTGLQPPQQIKVSLSALLMDSGNLNVYGYFDPDTVNYTFRMYGKLGEMPLTELNPFLEYAADIRLNSGHLDKAEFVMNGSDSIATGVLKANYQNLKITVLKPNGDLQPKKRGLLSMAANMIVRKDNPKYGFIYRIGTIAYIHDRSFSDIKFWIKAIISGIKSLVLFENKKEIKQINRLKMRFSAGSNHGNPATTGN